MKVKTIGISHPFHLTQFLIPKVYVDVELEDGEELNEEKKAELMAKTMEMEQYYRNNIGSMAGGATVDFSNHEYGLNVIAPPRSQQTQPEEPKDLSAQIRSCTQMYQLAIYEKIIDRMKSDVEKRKLWLVYDEMFEKLKPHEAK